MRTKKPSAWIVMFLAGLAGIQAAVQISPARLVENLKNKAYEGHPIDLDFTGADLRDVLARLEETAGIKFEIARGLDVQVSIHLKQTPWDQALAQLLTENRLEIGPAFDRVKIYRGSPSAHLVFKSASKARLFIFLYEYGLPILLAAAVVAALWILFRKIRRKKPRPEKPLLDGGRTEDVIRLLNHLLGEEAAYRDDNLTLQALAQRLEITPHQLSWVINRRLETSFADLINLRRLDEVKSRLADPEETSSILQIAFDAGFGTKGAFNRIFKNATGMTPSEFKRRAVEHAAGRSDFLLFLAFSPDRHYSLISIPEGSSGHSRLPEIRAPLIMESTFGNKL
jgi:AraC-like DNA-binding protein